MTSRVLLTGASGFVGRAVTSNLLKSNLKLRLVSRIGSRFTDEVRDSADRVIESPDIFHEDADWWASTCEGVEFVIHLAWYTNHHDYLYSARNLDCLIGTLNLARGFARAGGIRFIGIGTCLEYDLRGEKVSVSNALNPLLPYSAAKASAYLTLTQFFREESISFSWCRLFHLYGDGEDANRLFPFVRSRIQRNEVVKIRGSNQVRDYMDVKEAGARIGKVAVGTVDGPINICSGLPVTIKSVAEAIADEYGKRSLLQFGRQPDNPRDPEYIVGIPSAI